MILDITNSVVLLCSCIYVHKNLTPIRKVISYNPIATIRTFQETDHIQPSSKNVNFITSIPFENRCRLQVAYAKWPFAITFVTRFATKGVSGCGNKWTWSEKEFTLLATNENWIARVTTCHVTTLFVSFTLSFSSRLNLLDLNTLSPALCAQLADVRLNDMW